MGRRVGFGGSGQISEVFFFVKIQKINRGGGGSSRGGRGGGRVDMNEEVFLWIQKIFFFFFFGGGLRPRFSTLPSGPCKC